MDRETRFAGQVPEVYDRCLVPVLFAPYAAELAARVTPFAPAEILEIAAGTGVLAKALVEALPDAVIVATDLNQPMIDLAARRITAPGLRWQQADALDLPFADETFDAVVCQFGVMFMPDKPATFAEARRVLRPGGLMAFATWDRVEGLPLLRPVIDALRGMFPDDPPDFIERVPHGYHDVSVISADVRAGGLVVDRIETVTLTSRAASADQIAEGWCGGTPMRAEIERRAPDRLPEAMARVRAAVEAEFGAGPFDVTLSAHLVTARRPA